MIVGAQNDCDVLPGLDSVPMETVVKGLPGPVARLETALLVSGKFTVCYRSCLALRHCLVDLFGLGLCCSLQYPLSVACFLLEVSKASYLGGLSVAFLCCCFIRPVGSSWSALEPSLTAVPNVHGYEVLVSSGSWTP